jgi:hypothetical protein
MIIPIIKFSAIVMAKLYYPSVYLWRLSVSAVKKYSNCRDAEAQRKFTRE